MTKYRVKVEKHVEEHWTEGKTLCDFCHCDVDKVPAEKGSTWDNSEIEIEAKLGATYPEGDFRTGYRLDCCAQCFQSKVKPAIEALGAEWHEFSAEDAYLSTSYGEYYVDDYKRMDGKMASDIELSPPPNK